jgi:FkbM family methyltransferase
MTGPCPATSTLPLSAVRVGERDHRVARSMKKLIRTIQSELPFAKSAKDALRFWSLRLLRRPHEADFRVLSMLPAGCCIDVGANQGQSIESILLFQPGAKIVAFEANPRLAAKLTRRYRNQESIRINEFGLSNISGTFNLYIPSYNGFEYDALASMDREHAASWIGTETVYRFRRHKLRVEEAECRTTTLDSFDLEPVFLKVDVEGLEYAVLQGATATLSKHNPVVLLEYSEADDRAKRLLQSLGYAEYAYDGSGFDKGPSGRDKPNSFFIPPKYEGILLSS